MVCSLKRMRKLYLGRGRTLQAALGLHRRTRCPGWGGMGPQGPLLPLLFHDGLVLEVGQLGQAEWLPGPWPSPVPTSFF